MGVSPGWRGRKSCAALCQRPLLNPHSSPPRSRSEAQQRQLPVWFLGSGSNTVFADEGFNGLVVLNRLTRFQRVSSSEEAAVIEVGRCGKKNTIWQPEIDRKRQRTRALAPSLNVTFY